MSYVPEAIMNDLHRNPGKNAKFMADTVKILLQMNGHYMLANGAIVLGQPISFVERELRDAYGWKSLGSFVRDRFEVLGFGIKPGKGTQKGQRQSSEVLFLNVRMP